MSITARFHIPRDGSGLADVEWMVFEAKKPDTAMTKVWAATCKNKKKVVRASGRGTTRESTPISCPFEGELTA